MNSNNIIKALTSHCVKKLRQYNIKCIYPEASWYVFIDCSLYQEKLQNKNIYTSSDLTNRILKDINVAILPGVFFGMPESHYTARLCLVNFNGGVALNNIPKNHIITEQWLQKYCRRTLKGLQLLIDWLIKL